MAAATVVPLMARAKGIQVENRSTRCALLLNDMQYDLVNKNEARKTAVEKAMPRILKVLANARDIGVLVVHMQLVLEASDPKVERFQGRVPCLRGTCGVRVLEELVAQQDLVVEKRKDSAFYETELDDILKGRDIDTTAIAGMQTQICVQTTAADAYFRGYNVVVPSDLVVSARDVDRRRALEWLGSYCATVTTSSDLLRLLKASEVSRFTPPVIP